MEKFDSLLTRLKSYKDEHGNLLDHGVVLFDVSFRDFHGFNLAYHVGTPIILTGNAGERAGLPLITKITDLKSLY